MLNYLKVKYNLEEVGDSRVDDNLFMKGAKWAEFTQKSAVENLEKFYKYPKIYQRKAKKHQASILETHSFRTIASTYTRAFGEVLCLGS